MYYFAYGSNMSQQQMKNRCPNSQLVGKGVLKNYRLNFLEFSPRWKGGCADVVEDATAETWGLVYKVSKLDIVLLDGFEGHPNFYKRITLPIKLENSKVIQVQVYTLVSKKSFIAPTSQYLNIIKSAAKENNFPKKYILHIKNVPTSN